MSDDDGTIYMPTKQEYIATGLLGIALYAIIVYLSVASAWIGFKSKSTRRFFGSIGLMALLELPRYFDLAVDGTYNSRVCYSFHIIAGIFFFLAFSIVCRQWSGLLQLGSYFRMVYGYHGLIISNVSFAIADVVAVGFCLTSVSLDNFFFSVAFVVITFIEGLRNCVYSGFLTYYGLKLVKRFWHFSRLERQASRRYCCYIADDQVFTRVVLRLTSVLFLTTLCFLCRMTMLVTKMAELHSPQEFTSRSFTLFGFWWFTFSDFLPRALPSLAFIFLMRTKRPARDQVNKGLNQADRVFDNSNAFQFVRLGMEADRDIEGNGESGRGNNDDFPRSYSFSGYSDDGMGEIDFQMDDTTKSILHNDQFVSEEREQSTESLSLTSFRDLQRSNSLSHVNNQATSNGFRFDNLASMHYSDDEADYETVAAAGDDEEEDDDIAGDKAIDSLLNLLTYAPKSSSNNSKNNHTGKHPRTGSYSGDLVANPPQTVSHTVVPPQQRQTSLSAASVAGVNSRSASLSESMPMPSNTNHFSNSTNNNTNTTTSSASSSSQEGGRTMSGSRGLGAAIKRMQQQQQSKPVAVSPLSPPPSAVVVSQHTIETHPEDEDNSTS